MGTLGHQHTANSRVEMGLREELALADRALSGIAPVLSHMLAAPGAQLISEEICARIRGMLDNLSAQLLVAAGLAANDTAAREQSDALRQYLTAESTILSHLYALATEWHITQRLENAGGIDPVLNPLLQELIAAEHPELAELAMKTMAAQSRFAQSQRRMQLVLTELPAELFGLVVRRTVVFLREARGELSPAGVQALKRTYDEGDTRLGLLARLVKAMNQGAVAALDLDHAGFAFFASALGILTEQPRELAILSCCDNQGARLALGLRAAGVGVEAIELQFANLGMSQSPPTDMQSLSIASAAAVLRDSGKSR